MDDLFIWMNGLKILLNDCPSAQHQILSHQLSKIRHFRFLPGVFIVHIHTSVYDNEHAKGRGKFMCWRSQGVNGKNPTSVGQAEAAKRKKFWCIFYRYLMLVPAIKVFGMCMQIGSFLIIFVIKISVQMMCLHKGRQHDRASWSPLAPRPRLSIV